MDLEAKKIMKLPQWHECRDNIELGVATPLEKFVFIYEPATISVAAEFRKELLAALEYVRKMEEPVMAEVCDETIPLPLLDQEPE
jgi:hypothetical protein